MKKYIFITFILLLIDLILSQTILLPLIEKNNENIYKNDLKNRIYNKNYKYTFKKNTEFISQYYGYKYKINTNNLGFRDETSENIDFNQTYNIVIGDSFVEGVALNYKDTLVGQLNNANEKNLRFLNAGVASYSSYIYYKKIKNIIEDNKDLKIKNIILLLDKSDVLDDIHYLEKPDFFIETKEKAYVNERKKELKEDLLNLNFFSFITKQTITGKTIKLLSDLIEEKLGNLKKRIVLSKKLNKSFFSITQNQIKSLKSINNRKFITNTFVGKQWNEKAIPSINFSIENINLLNNYLITKKIKLYVVLYPWSFELDDYSIADAYLEYLIPKLKKNKINIINTYNSFTKNEIYELVGDIFIYNDIHYNKKGYKIIAENILKNLKN